MKRLVSLPLFALVAGLFGSATALAQYNPHRWVCVPGVRTPVRMKHGDIQCATRDGRDCLWNACPGNAPQTFSWNGDRRGLVPLTCGAQHQALFGVDGYSQPNHWCQQACVALGCARVRAPRMNGVVLFADANFRGRRQLLTPGRYDLGALASGIGNDRLSSIRVPPGFHVVLFADAGFRGRWKRVDGDLPWIGNDFNDVASSLIVYGPGEQVFPPPTPAGWRHEERRWRPHDRWRPQPMPPSDFQGLKQAINAEAFSQGKLGVLRTAAGQAWFTCQQAGELVDLYAFSQDKLAALAAVRPHLVDPGQGYTLVGHFAFSADKEKARELLR